MNYYRECQTCEGNRRINMRGRWVPCPQCVRFTSEAAKSAARLALRDCARKWKRGETDDINFQLAIQSYIDVGYTLRDARDLTGGLSTEQLRRVLGGQVSDPSAR